MPSKIKPIPVRLGDERRALVQDHARTTGKSEHGAILDLIDAGLGEVGKPASPKPMAKAVLAAAEDKAAHLATPKPKNPRSRWKLDVPLGPAHVQPGSRLKHR